MKFGNAVKWWGWRNLLFYWAFPPFMRYIGWLPIGIGAARWRLRTNLYRHQKGLCYYCGLEMSLTARNKKGGPARSFATFEHLVRRQDGGTNRAGNVVLAHSKCNARKNVMDQRKQSEERRLAEQRRLSEERKREGRTIDQQLADKFYREQRQEQA